MSNKSQALIVTFEKDMNPDDVQQIIAAISLLKGVIDVSDLPSDLNMHIAKMQVYNELREKINALFS